MAHSLTRTLSPTHPLALTFKPLLSIFLLSSFSFLLLFFFGCLIGTPMGKSGWRCCKISAFATVTDFSVVSGFLPRK